MKKAKKVFAILLCVFVLIALPSCQEPEPELTINDINFDYEIKKEGDIYYMIFEDPRYFIPYTSNKINEMSVMERNPSFSSIREMKEAFFEKKLPIEYLNDLKRWSFLGSTKVPLIDFDNIYFVSVPETITSTTVNYLLRDYRGDYKFKITYGEENKRADIEILSKGEFNQGKFDLIFTNNTDNFLDIKFNYGERNAIVYVTDHPYEYDAYRYVVYTVRSEGKEITVEERYKYINNYGALNEYGTPELDSVDVYGECDGKYFHAYFRDMEESPSDEWLLALDVILYDEADENSPY